MIVYGAGVRRLGVRRYSDVISDLPPPVRISAHMEASILQEISRVTERYDGEHMYALNKNEEEGLQVYSDFDTRIIIWHIATHLILHSIHEQNGDADFQFQDKMTTINRLSDYMMFLLIEQPDMLPGHIYSPPPIHESPKKPP